MHRVGVRKQAAGWVLQAGLAFWVCALFGGLWPIGAGAASALDAPVPFEAWRIDDEAGLRRSLGYAASRTAWGLAEFMAGAELNITKIEFWTTDATTEVDLYLYDGFDGSTLGTELASKLDNAFDIAGFQSVALDVPVAVTSGDRIVVVLKVTNTSRGHPLLLDGEDSAGIGCTFASPDGDSGSWYDVGAGGHGVLAISLDVERSSPDLADQGAHQDLVPLLTGCHQPPANGWTVIVEEDFEGSFPGEWQLHDGDPGEGLYLLGPRTCRAYGGSKSGWVVGDGDGAGLGCQSAYPRYVESWMVYGPFSLADAAAAQLAYQLWLNSEPEYDGVFSGASVDGVDFYGYWVTGNSAGWVQQVLDLRAVPELGNLSGQEEVWIALLFVSDGVVRMQQGAFIDDIVLRKYTGTLVDLQEEVVSAFEATAQRKEATFSLRR